MPVHKQGSGWQWGSQKIYHGKDAKKNAIKQGLAVAYATGKKPELEDDGKEIQATIDAMKARRTTEYDNAFSSQESMFLLGRGKPIKVNCEQCKNYAYTPEMGGYVKAEDGSQHHPSCKKLELGRANGGKSLNQKGQEDTDEYEDIGMGEEGGVSEQDRLDKRPKPEDDSSIRRERPGDDIDAPERPDDGAVLGLKYASTADGGIIGRPRGENMNISALRTLEAITMKEATPAQEKELADQFLDVIGIKGATSINSRGFIDVTFPSTNDAKKFVTQAIADKWSVELDHRDPKKATVYLARKFTSSMIRPTMRPPSGATVPGANVPSGPTRRTVHGLG